MPPLESLNLPSKSILGCWGGGGGEWDSEPSGSQLWLWLANISGLIQWERQASPARQKYQRKMAGVTSKAKSKAQKESQFLKTTTDLIMLVKGSQVPCCLRGPFLPPWSAGLGIQHGEVCDWPVRDLAVSGRPRSQARPMLPPRPAGRPREGPQAPAITVSRDKHGTFLVCFIMLVEWMSTKCHPVGTAVTTPVHLELFSQIAAKFIGLRSSTPVWKQAQRLNLKSTPHMWRK